MRPASGISVRTSSGNTPRPKSTPSVSTAEDANARRASSKSRGTSGARQRTVNDAMTIIAMTQSQAHRIETPGSSSTRSKRPMAMS